MVSGGVMKLVVSHPIVDGPSVSNNMISGGSRGPGGHGPPVGGLKKKFWQYINIITKPTEYDKPWEY